MSHPLSAFLFIERVKLEIRIDCPIYLYVLRFGKTTLSKVTPSYVPDSEGVVVFNTEFCIPFRSSKKYKKHSKPKFLLIELGFRKSRMERTVVGQWKFDLAAFSDRENEELRDCAIHLSNGSSVVLYFRLVIKRPKTVSAGPYFASITSTRTTVHTAAPVSISRPTSVSEFSASHLADIVTANDTAAEPVIAPVRDIPRFLSFFSADEKEKGMDPKRPRLLHVLNEHRTMLAQIAFNQCSVAFSRAVISSFYGLPIRGDISEILIAPIRDYHFFQIPTLTPPTVHDFLEPLSGAIRFSLNLSHPVSVLFAHLITLLNFGIKLSIASFLYSPLHLPFIAELEAHISRICGLLAQNLSASVVQLGDFAANNECAAAMREDLHRFLGIGRELCVPEPVIEALLLDCGRLTDAILFNALIVTEDAFSITTAKDLAKRIRTVQQIFQCVSPDFSITFDSLSNLIAIIELYLGGVQPGRIGHPSPLVRDVVERCSPSVVLPPSISLDKIGPRPIARVDLSVEPVEFKFTFKWFVDTVGLPWPLRERPK
jgi:hypothetical protein